MREILFRGKRDKRYGEGWTYGVPYTDHEGDCIIATHCSKRVVDPETVGQYTGLTDKNKKKIYEGDIVKTKYGRLCLVKWRSTGCFCGFDLIPIEAKSRAPKTWDLFYSKNLEVVGNIHDNKEILNVK